MIMDYKQVWSDDKYCTISVYVDDMMLLCNSEAFLFKIKDKIKTKWSCKDFGEAKAILGMRSNVIEIFIWYTLVKDDAV